jgi:hypothetical protein
LTVDASSLWTKNLRLKGLSLAREKGWLLGWDKNHWLYLFNAAGELQGQYHCEEPLVSAAIADDGSALAAIGQKGLVQWLRPDFTKAWQRSLHIAPLGLALEPLAEMLAVTDARGGVHFFNGQGKLVSQFQSPRPLLYLAFVPSTAMLVGCADFGLVGALDLKGNWLWRDAPVVHTGTLAITGDASMIALASFSEGIHLYQSRGQKLGSVTLPESCPMVQMTFAGDLLLAAGMGRTLYFLDRNGKVLSLKAMEKPIQGLVLGALGNTAYVNLKDGDLVRLKIARET